MKSIGATILIAALLLFGAIVCDASQSAKGWMLVALFLLLNLACVWHICRTK